MAYRAPRAMGVEVTRAQVRVPRNHRHRAQECQANGHITRSALRSVLSSQDVLSYQKYKVQRSVVMGPEVARGLGRHSYRPSETDPQVLGVQEGAPVDQVC